MLLVAPDPRLGIAPERIARVRVLLDASPSAPGLAVALPGGPDGVLDALVLRPDGVLGLVPGRPRSRRAPVGAHAGGGVPSTGSLPSTSAMAAVGAHPSTGSLPATSSFPGAAAVDDGGEDAADELERLLALCDPAPTAPRQVVPIGEGGAGAAAGARLALGAPVGTAVLAADEVRRLFAALRLAEHVPGADALAAAGFAGHTVRPRSGATPASVTGWATENRNGSGPRAAETRAPETRAPETRAADTRAPGTRATGARPLTAQTPEARPTDPRGAAYPAPPVPPTAPVPRSGSGPRRPGAHLGAYGSGAGLPGTGLLPAGHPGDGADAGSGRRGLALPGWLWSWRGLVAAATVVFVLAAVLALLLVRSATPTASVPAGPAVDPSTARTVNGVAYQREASTTDTTCDNHAYGLAAQFLRERPCVRLDRSLWSGTGPGGPVVLAVSVVRMGDAGSASALKSLIDSSGTGNLSDLLREGRTFPGAPTGLTDAGYGSALQGDTVVVAEVDWLDGNRAEEPTLDRLASDAVGAGVGRP